MDGGGDADLEQFLQQPKAVFHWPKRERAVGGEAPPAPAVAAILDYVEGGRARASLLVCGAIIVKGTPAQIPAPLALELRLWCQIRQEIERRDLGVHPAN